MADPKTLDQFDIKGRSALVTGAASGIVGMVLLTVAFILIVHRRTRGGWRCRWGTDD